jgi:hypothetical protein
MFACGAGLHSEASLGTDASCRLPACRQAGRRQAGRQVFFLLCDKDKKGKSVILLIPHKINALLSINTLIF